MNLNLLSLLFILNSFINLSNQVDFRDLKPFYCEEIDKNLNYFKNQEKFIFIVENDIFHLIFKNRQFAFKNFYFGGYDENEQSDELIVGHPYIDKEESLNEFVKYDHLGIINDNDNEIYLYYKIDTKSNPDCYKLDYESGKIEKFYSNVCFDFFDKKSFEKVRQFIHYFVKDKFKYLIKYSIDNKKIEITRTLGNLQSRLQLKIDYKIKMAAISNVYSNDSKIDYFNLYEMNKNFTIHINRIKTKLDNNDNSLIKEFKYEKRISLNKLNFTNIIGCIDKITELNQIKGILFKDNKFYIISYRKYWIYESDLINERFNLNYTNSSSNYFRFINENDLLSAEYEIRFSKWIKQLDNENYFMPYKNSIFEIQFNNDNENSTNNLVLQLEKSDKESLNYCKGSTIRFDNDDYCFESTKYFKIKLFKDNDNKSDNSNIKYPISDLFKNTPYNYINDDKLLFIFKYTNDLYAFITIKSILLIDINLFIKTEDYLRLKSPRDDNEFFFDENCLLRECSPFSKPRGIVYPNNYSLIISIILSVLFIIIMLFGIFSYIRRKQNDKKPFKLHMKNFNLINLKDNFSTYFNRQITGFRKSIFSQPRSKSKKISRNMSELDDLDSKSQSSRFSFLALKDRLNRKGGSRSSYGKIPRDKLRSTQTYPIFSSKSKERILRHAKINQIP